MGKPMLVGVFWLLRQYVSSWPEAVCLEMEGGWVWIAASVVVLELCRYVRSVGNAVFGY